MIQVQEKVKAAGTSAAQLYSVFLRNAERTLLIDARNGEAYTYGRFLQESRALASWLQEKGVLPGEAVVFSMENCVELAVLYFACWHVGARVVPVNPSYHPRDYAAITENVDARYFITTPAVRAKVDAILQGLSRLQVFCLSPAVEPCKPEQRCLINLDYLEEATRRAPAARTFAEAANDDICLTMFTSGTSGLPKGINIRFGGIIDNAEIFCQRLGLNSDNRFYNVLAMTYLGGLYNLMLIPMVAEGSIILDSVFGPSNVFGFWEQVKDCQINTLWFSPTMLSMLLMLEDETDLSFLKSQVRAGICGMAPLPVDLKKRFEARFGFPLFENYGLSETTFLTANYAGLRPKPGSVGTTLQGVTVRILDGDGKPVPSGREGQIGVQSPYLMAGYEKEGDVRWSMAKNGGYFLTGDIGYLDTDGELFITGRLKDIIIRGGINISPKLIEDVIYGMEAVQEAAVVGVPHPMYGEEVALVVKLREGWRERTTIEDIQKYCEARIAHFQRPKLFFFIDEIPKGATGKIQKNAIKRMLQEKLDPLNG